MTVFIVGCIPVNDARNRAYAQRMGVGGTPFPPPYRNSVLATCEDCGGSVHVGPNLQASREAMTRDRKPFRLLCLICASLEARSGSVALLQLSGKRSELGE